MTAFLILLVSDDSATRMEMNKFEEEMSADYSKTFTSVSTGRLSLEALSCFATCC
jgi:hypothetical protein